MRNGLHSKEMRPDFCLLSPRSSLMGGGTRFLPLRGLVAGNGRQISPVEKSES
jgi:hypothetical protein